MENIDIIIVAGVSFLLVVGGLFIGMYFARRAEAVRVAKLEEREERLLRMRARFEHERFAVSAEDSDGDVLLDEDLFKGFKEEIEQERIELDMRREEIELDMRMLEEENERLKSRLPSGRSTDVAVETEAEEATIVDVETADSRDDIEDAVFEEPPDSEETDEDAFEDVAEDDVPLVSENDDTTNADADEHLVRNTIFGDFFFDDSTGGDSDDFDEEDSDEDDSSKDEQLAAADQDAEPDVDAEVQADDQTEDVTEYVTGDQAEVEEEPDPVDDGWASEPDEIEQPGLNVRLTEPVGGDGAAGDRPPDTPDRSEPARAAFDHMLTSDGERPADGTFEQVLGLSKSDLALMNDLGYGTFRSIADLGDEEIERLAAAFDISERTIRDEWMPDSRMRLAREPRA